MNLTQEDVQEILRLLDASSFDELHLETERFKLTLRRSSGGSWTQENQTVAAPHPVSATPTSAQIHPTPDAAPAEAEGASRSTEQGSVRDDVFDVRTPIIGTFYRAPKPGAAPFVEVGSRVEAETVVGIVETMKLMNSVYAGVTGEVLEIHARDGQLVEQSHVLLRVRRTDK